MKKLLRQLVLGSFLLISTQHMQAGWWDDFTTSVSSGWNRFTSWVTDTWNSAYSWWYKTPGASKATTGAVVEAYKEKKQLTEDEKIQQNILNQALQNFLSNLQSFIHDLGLASKGSPAWSQLLSTNKIIIEDLDSIKEHGMPYTILEAAQPLKNEKLLQDLQNTFAFLRPQLTWHDLNLHDLSGLTALKAPYETFQSLAVYIKNFPQRGESLKYNSYQKWLAINANQMSKQKNKQVRPLIPAESKDLRFYLTVLRHYKIDSTFNKLKDNAVEFSGNIGTVYRNIKSAVAPSMLWLQDPKLFEI